MVSREVKSGLGMESIRSSGGNEDDFLVCPNAGEAALAGAALHVTASCCGGFVAFHGQLEGRHCCFDREESTFRLSLGNSKVFILRRRQLLITGRRGFRCVCPHPAPLLRVT